MEKKTEASLSVQEMMEYQLRLQEKYAGVWEGDNPGTAKHAPMTVSGEPALHQFSSVFK